MSSGDPVQNTGEEFDDADVARAYLKRPPYPDALHDRLAALAPAHGHLLDLGCGPGKLARALAGRFAKVTAVDPATPMIALGQSEDAGRHPHIRWLCTSAEEADFGAPVDLAVAGASLHWMRHSAVFPRLADALGLHGRIVTVGGDGPTTAPRWLPGYRALIRSWVERLGFVFDHPDFRARMTAHEAWIDIEGRETFTARRRMPIEDLIEAEHSRATWARSKMGDTAAAFDEDLRAFLAPHADAGWIEFDVESQIAWGRARRAPRP